MNVENLISKNLIMGYARHKIILDDSGKPYDYKFLETNATFEKLTGLKKEEIIGKTVRETIPGIEKSDFDWIGFYGKIALEGGEKDFKQYSEPLEKWYRVLAYSTEKMYFTTLFVDITEQKQSEKALKESEERLDMALEIKNEGIWDWNLITDQTVFDDRYYTMAGYEPNEFPHNFKAWGERVHPEDLPACNSAIKAYLSGQSERFDIEFRFRHKNGSWIWIRGQGKIVERDKNGSPLRMIGTHTDISKRKEAEIKLRNNRENLAATLRSIGDGVISCDKKERVVDINKAAETLTGWTKKEAVGQPLKKVFNIINAKTRKTAENPAAKALSEGVNVDLANHTALTSRDGTEYQIADCCSPIRDKTEKITGAVLVFRDVTEKYRQREKLRESESRNRALLEALPDLMFVISKDGFFIDYNTNNKNNLLVSPEKFLSKHVSEVLPPELASLTLEKLHKAFESKQTEIYNYKIDTSKKTGYFESRLVYINENSALAIIRDITKHKKAEEEKENLQNQLAHAQKMESVGRLAGGVAHDFNNMLGAILGQTELALLKVNPDETLYRQLKSIQKAAERSANLTRQLLAFARKQTICPQVLNLNKTIAGMLDMLQRLIGENIELVWEPAPKLWFVRTDSSQIDQILANLCVNAKDAISDTGKIIIETSNAAFDDSHSGDHINFIKGDFVQISVSDNGCGMDLETKTHLFEPFFTTKDIGKGTGLGLATVHGIVKQNKGFINVYSEKGQGTVFKIYLPRYAKKDEQSSKSSEQNLKTSKGSGTVLLVEDEPMLLEMTMEMIRGLGYTVLTAETPVEATKIAHEHSGRINILLTDVVMPEMNGRALAKNLRSIYPDIHCVFMSGYTANVIAHQGILEENINFLQKPFSLKDLADILKKSMD